MSDETTKLTIRLPREQIEFAKRYAKHHGITVTEVISRYLRLLQGETPTELSPELQQFVGILPADLDVDAARLEYLTAKHLK